MCSALILSRSSRNRTGAAANNSLQYRRRRPVRAESKEKQHLAENILRDLKTSDPGYTLQIRNKEGEIVTEGEVSTGCTLEVLKIGQTVPSLRCQ